MQHIAIRHGGGSRVEQYKLFEQNARLTEIAVLIMAEDLEALAQQVKDGWDINAPLPIC
jgi:hypothetical protein